MQKFPSRYVITAIIGAHVAKEITLNVNTDLIAFKAQFPGPASKGPVVSSVENIFARLRRLNVTLVQKLNYSNSL